MVVFMLLQLQRLNYEKKTINILREIWREGTAELE